MLFVAATLFVACSDKSEDGPLANPNPEKLVAGTYTGNWTRVLDKDTTTAPGQITVTADSAFIATFAVAKCAELGLDEMSSKANVTWQSNGGLRITNYGGANNGFQTSFAGKLNADRTLSLNFKKTVKVGRKAYEYVFTFTGKQ